VEGVDPRVPEGAADALKLVVVQRPPLCGFKPEQMDQRPQVLQKLTGVLAASRRWFVNVTASDSSIVGHAFCSTTS